MSKMIYSSDKFIRHTSNTLSTLGTSNESDFLNIAVYKNIRLFTKHRITKGKPLEIMVARYRYYAYVFTQLSRLTNWRYQTRFNLYVMLDNNDHIKKIPYYQRNIDIICTLITLSVNRIGFIPEEMMKPEYIQDIHAYSFDKIEYLSDRLKTCRAVIKVIAYRPGKVIYIPDDMLTHDIITYLISLNRDVIDYLPDHIATKYRRYPPRSS